MTISNESNTEQHPCRSSSFFENIPTPLFINTRFRHVLNDVVKGKDVDPYEYRMLVLHAKSNNVVNTTNVLRVALGKTLVIGDRSWHYVIWHNLSVLYFTLYPNILSSTVKYEVGRVIHELNRMTYE